MKKPSRPTSRFARGISATTTAALFATLGPGALLAQEKPATPTPPKEGADKKEAAAEEETEYLNWVNLGFGGSIVDGDAAAYQQRLQLPEGVFGGVEGFHWEKTVGKKGVFKIDGRGLFDNHDYLLKLGYTVEDKGYVQAGYREYRTWYDGSGGFFPASQTWLSLYDEEMAIDRRELWFEAGLRMPKLPNLTFRYSHQERDGTKDSTSWGEALLVQPTGPSVRRNIVPSFWNIDESRDVLRLDGSHKIGKTRLGLGGSYEWSDNDNSRNTRVYPPNSLGYDPHITQRESTQTDLLNAHLSTETKFNEKLALNFGYAYTTLDTDISGSRIEGQSYGAAYDPGLATRPGFLDLTGGGLTKQHVATVSLLAQPSKTLQIIPSVRVEQKDIEALSAYLSNPGELPGSVTSDQSLLNLSERIEARYNGVTNWVFYARGDWTQGDGDLSERQADTSLQRDTDYTRTLQQYTAGANWYPLRKLNLGAQYFYRIRENEYTHNLDSTSNAIGSLVRYPAYLAMLDNRTQDANLRITVRPLANLTLIGRYDYQISDIDSRADGLGEVQASEMEAHIFSLSASWVPWSRMFVQIQGSYTLDETETGAVGVVPGLVLSSEHDYWNVGFTVGFVIDDKTDLQAQYFYLKADNFEDNSAFSQPYGVGLEEQSITASLSRRIRKNLVATLKYGYYTSDDETSGGNNDFDAHLIYAGMQYQF